MKPIRSETEFVWRFLWDIIKTPLTLILIVFKRKEIEDLFRPFKDLFKFVFEPKFTISIIILNIIMFFISFLILTEQQFINLINYPSDLINLRFQTLITAGFLHANLSHLIGNMIGIFIFGRVVEKRLGFFKTMMIFFGALALSSMFESLIHLIITGDNIGGLGASGALMGLVSTAILLDPFHLTYEFIFPIPIMLIGWFAIFADIIGILNPVQEGIGHFAHIGGFISIGILMFLLGENEKMKLKKGLIVNIASIIFAILMYFLFIK
jgi:membrane associated rhomboid family serine protease